MHRIIGWTGGAAMLVMGLAAAASAQDRPSTAPTPQPRWSVEGAAGVQIDYDGNSHALAVGFAPTRSVTLLVSADRSHIQDEFRRYADGYASERGGTTRFVSAEFRYAFLPTRRVSPYVLAGRGRGTFRQNVSAMFPNAVTRRVDVLYYGGGARIPVRRWLDVFADARFTLTADEGAEMGVFMPVRAGVALRF